MDERRHSAANSSRNSWRRFRRARSHASKWQPIRRRRTIPEGTAGIINIVLNQQADAGLSGGLNASTGTTRQANLSGNIGRQSGPLTLYLSASIYRDHRNISGSSDRTNLVIPVPAFVESHSDGHAQPRFQSMTFRSQYKLTENDALSADAMLSGGRFARQNTAFYSDLDAEREVIGLFNQGNDQVWRNLSQNYVGGIP